MRPTPTDLNEKIALRIRTMRILWLALMMSIGSYFLYSMFVFKPGDRQLNNTLSLILVIAGMFATIVSVLVRQKIVSIAIERKNELLVQQGYIVAWALCEASALMGLVDFLVTGNRFYYVPFVIGLLGDLINFPRRQDVEDVLF
jgi:hypothetical protein